MGRKHIGSKESRTVGERLNHPARKGAIMNPFSPLMYIRRNWGRAISIILMLMCTSIIFMGGMYIDNVYDQFTYAYEDPSQYAFWVRSGNNNDVQYEAEDFKLNKDKYLPESAKTYLDADILYGSTESIMGFSNGNTWVFLKSREDFDTFVRLTDILPKDIDIEDGEVVLSEQLANNWGLKEGDVISGTGDDAEIGFPSPMTVKKILPLKGMQIYGWSSDMITYGGVILATEENTSTNPGFSDELNLFKEKVEADYPHILVVTNESEIHDTKEEMSILTYLFMILIVIVAVVFAVTVNATFAAMYDKRKYEFSVYKALGISKGKMFGKVLGELVTMDGIALVFGAILCFVTIKVLNEILWEQGLYFIRPSVMGILGTVFCNIAIIIPVVLANMRRIKKYDVTVF